MCVKDMAGKLVSLICFWGLLDINAWSYKFIEYVFVFLLGEKS